MKEAQVAKDLKVTVKDVAVPEPQANQVIIKVVVSGSNPKDWYVMFFLSCLRLEIQINIQQPQLIQPLGKSPPMT
jgi:NADPH:quinone reductase-like Zn-dependent oxidoreductase